MASYTGYVITEDYVQVYGTPRNDRIFLHGSWGNFWGSNWGGYLGFDADSWSDVQTGGGGARTDNSPISFREESFTGYYVGGYGDVFYNRILIEPNTLAFGDLVSETSLDFTLWNAFLESKTVTSLDEDGFDAGLDHDVTAPYAYYALEEKTYNITASMDGGPTIEATLTFNFSFGSYDVTMSGSSIVMLPVMFKPGMREEIEWLTTVLEAYDGTEQRYRTRLIPRHRFDIEAYLDRLHMHRVENLLYGWRHQRWIVPMWHEARRLTSSVGVGDTVINASTLYGDFRIDSMAVLWKSQTYYDVFGIDDFDDTTITSTRQILNAYSTADWLIPVRSCRMISAPQRKTTGYNAQLSTTLQVVDNAVVSSSASAIQYNSEDTYFGDQLTSSGSPDTYEKRIDILDNETGLQDWYTPWDITRIGRQFEVVLEGLQEIWEFRQWLHRRSGRLRPFYAPTWESNFKLQSEGTITDSFTALTNNYSTQSTARDNIVFIMTDGTYEVREVTASSVVGDVLSIQFTPNLDRDASEVDEIDYFGLKRLGTDLVEFEHLANNVALVTVPIIEIEP